LAGLRKADAIITDSAHVKRTLIDHLHLPTERVFPIHLPINRAHFRPLDVPDDFRARYGLDRNFHYIIFTGSDEARKNIRNLILAMPKVRAVVPNAILLKVGKPHDIPVRGRLLRLVDELNAGAYVQFRDDVLEDLPLLYNAVDAAATVSLHEGFGYPPLEAMGEIVGDAALTVDPTDVDAIAAALIRLLTNDGLRAALRARGLRHVRRFDLATFSEQVRGVYDRVVRCA
jgi:glycosyltransferase involved in cell wall biosynthesis